MTGIREVKPKVTLMSYTAEPDSLVAFASRLCYTGKTGSDLYTEGLTSEEIKRGVNLLHKNGHESPFEHVNFTFLIEGVSRSLLAQITRHRIASFSVQSQRYVKMNNFQVIVPDEIESEPKAKALFMEQMNSSIQSYNEIATILEEKYKQQGLDAKSAEKKAIENARAVLPNSASTQLIMTMNARSLFNFFEERCCNRAQEEIRGLAWQMLKLVREKAPLIFAEAGPTCVRGKCKETTMSCGKPYKKAE